MNDLKNYSSINYYRKDMNMEMEDSIEIYYPYHTREPRERKKIKHLWLLIFSASGLAISLCTLLLMIYSYPHFIGTMFVIFQIILSSGILFVCLHDDGEEGA